jgi:hypothetical protein
VTRELEYNYDEKGYDQTNPITPWLQVVEFLSKPVELVIAHPSKPCRYFLGAEPQVQKLHARLSTGN